MANKKVYYECRLPYEVGGEMGGRVYDKYETYEKAHDIAYKYGFEVWKVTETTEEERIY